MSCELAHSVVHGYFDGELDAVRAAEFEHHLETCAECQASLERIESLRAQVQQGDLYERASLPFREQIRQQLERVAPVEQGPVISRLRLFLMPAFAALALAAGIILAWSLMPSRAANTRITAELIDAHVRSLQPGHLTDVQSTDQHTVKPWFDGKLDFIPPVSDYSQQGFSLLGGRLDIIDGHTAAALIYARRKHIINLFVWPDRGTQPLAGGSGSHQGYNWSTWVSHDMQFCLVSDVSAADLDELKELIRRKSP
ncbi:MAG: anti-sigma factor family protein [Chlamydiota bacterium]